MACVTLYMNACGLVFAPEICEGCGRAFERGERMSAVEDGDGEPMGWFCDGCIADWKEKGIKSRVFRRDGE